MKLDDYLPYTELVAYYDPKADAGTYLLCKLKGHLPITTIQQDYPVTIYKYYAVAVFYGRGFHKHIVHKFYQHENTRISDTKIYQG